jgi:hypothetical protein
MSHPPPQTSMASKTEPTDLQLGLDVILELKNPLYFSTDGVLLGERLCVPMSVARASEGGASGGRSVSLIAATALQRRGGMPSNEPKWDLQKVASCA